MQKDAVLIHSSVPPDWYFQSIRRNPFQRFWHKRRFREVGKIIEPADKVLDIGCADGVFTNIIFKKTKAKKIIGIDVLETSIVWSKRHWKRNRRMKFMVGDAHELKFKAGSFDAVFVLEALEHVFNPQKVLEEVKRVLKKGGYAVFLVPSENALFKIIWWFVSTFWWARIWQNCHVQSFDNSNKLSDLCRSLGFKIEEDRRFLLGMLNVVKVRKR